jgi:CRP/FNR family transcriptional regulator, cyclic AMP receptor protein
MPLIPDKAAFQNNLANLPLVTYQPGETVIADGSRTGRLLILRKGTVAIVKHDTEIAKVAEPGAVFGELSILLDQPHTADVRALETSQFHVANATTLLAQNPTLCCDNTGPATQQRKSRSYSIKEPASDRRASQRGRQNGE